MVSKSLARLLLLLCIASSSNAWYEAEHRTFKKIAVVNGIENTFSLDQCLRDQLLMKGGLKEPVGGRTVLAWIDEGGAIEDTYPRYRNHFHNPLQAWDEAGLQLTFGPLSWNGVLTVR